MRKYYYKANERKLNLDWIEDAWLWLVCAEPVQKTSNWTDEEIIHLFDCLLQDSLRNLLDTRCSLKTVREIHGWIMNIGCLILQTPSGRPLCQDTCRL